MQACGNRSAGVYFLGIAVRVHIGDRDMGWCSEIYDPLDLSLLGVVLKPIHGDTEAFYSVGRSRDTYG
jgi:hypothetical protein